MLHLDRLILCCHGTIQKLHLLSMKFFCNIVACLRDLETCLQAVEKVQAVPHMSTEFDCMHSQFAWTLVMRLSAALQNCFPPVFSFLSYKLGLQIERNKNKACALTCVGIGWGIWASVLHMVIVKAKKFSVLAVCDAQSSKASMCLQTVHRKEVAVKQHLFCAFNSSHS